MFQHGFELLLGNNSSKIIPETSLLGLFSPHSSDIQFDPLPDAAPPHMLPAAVEQLDLQIRNKDNIVNFHFLEIYE